MEPRARMMSLDIGRKRIGLAVTDPLGGGVLGLDTLQRRTTAEDLTRIANLARERKVVGFVVGLPLHMNGTEGEMVAFVRSFGARLEKKTQLPVHYQDERLTSVEAEDRLSAGGLSLEGLLKQKRAGAVDRLAAVILLEDYLRAQEQE